MKHIHLSTCNSTQLYLQENLSALRDNGPEILVSCCQQTAGIGRNGKKWDSFSNNLAFSFTLSPCQNATLTPLEVGIHLAHFFNQQYNTQLGLKWPNDLLNTAYQKCGGIICHYQDNNTIIVGVGINFGPPLQQIDQKKYDHPISFISSNLPFSENEKETIPAEIYRHILANRISATQIRPQWENLCLHQNKQVDTDSYQDCKFVGIGTRGEALIKKNDKIFSVISGSLRICS